MAEILVCQGANLALVDIDHAKLQTTVQLCAKFRVKVKDYPADVTDEPAVEGLFRSVYKTSVASMASSAMRALRATRLGESDGR